MPKFTRGDIEYMFENMQRSRIYLAQLKALASIVDPLKPEKYLEIGSFDGLPFALFIFLATDFNASACLEITAVDSWAGGDEHKAAEMDMSNVESVFDKISARCGEICGEDLKLEKLKGQSRNALIKLAGRPGYYDLILIDAGHKSKEVLSDLVLAWDLLRAGGVLIVDDYTWTPMHVAGGDLLLNSPKLGIDSFVNCYADEISFLSNMPLLQLYLIKQSPLSLGSHYIHLPQVDLPEPLVSFF